MHAKQIFHIPPQPPILLLMEYMLVSPSTPKPLLSFDLGMPCHGSPLRLLLCSNYDPSHIPGQSLRIRYAGLPCEAHLAPCPALRPPLAVLL
jgi:hypothetical protein